MERHRAAANDERLALIEKKAKLATDSVALEDFPTVNELLAELKIKPGDNA